MEALRAFPHTFEKPLIPAFLLHGSCNGHRVPINKTAMNITILKPTLITADYGKTFYSTHH
jgi:hypothetical protein